MAGVLGATVDVDAVRARFSSLRQGFAFFDAPGGTQVPDEVGDAMALALREASANLGASYATSIRVGKILEEAEGKAARFLGCEPREVIFGPNMTTLNFALSRTAARAFSPGDEILVSCFTTTRRWTSRTWNASSDRAPRWSRSPGPPTRSARS